MLTFVPRMVTTKSNRILGKLLFVQIMNQIKRHKTALTTKILNYGAGPALQLYLVYIKKIPITYEVTMYFFLTIIC